MDDGPTLIESGLSQDIEGDGFRFQICIYRLEQDTEWTLEVVDVDDASHVWDAPFPSEFAALIEAQKAIRSVGAMVFMSRPPAPTLH